MIKYYTRPCNFYYGSCSKKFVKIKKSLPLAGNNSISFNCIEIIEKNKKNIKSKIIKLEDLKFLKNKEKIKILKDLKKITKKRTFFNNKNHYIMGVVNMTPDSFSDGGKYNSKRKAEKQIKRLIKSGADIIDIGGESTRPGSKTVNSLIEWSRVKNVIKGFKKDFPKILLSIDTRKSHVMKNAFNFNADIINDVSCFNFEKESFNIVKNKNVFKIIHHMQGTPKTMQKNPRYNHVLLDVYDFFEKQIARFKKDKYNKKLILDPGIGFGKNLKHNLILMNKISLFHSLGFPVLIGTSRKKFISQISKKYITKERLGGTLSSVIFSLSQGVQIFRVHDVREVKQGLKVFESLIYK